MKYAKWTFIGIISFLFFYLGTVWIWANAAGSNLLSELHDSSPVVVLKPQHATALIRIEDPTFYEHSGLDISNGQGLTTITSGLAKMVFLGDHQLDGAQGALQSFYRGVFNCCKKIDLGRDVMALVLNSKATKQDQLNLFASSAYLGSKDGKGIIGFENAATAYYDKELSELTEDEFYGLVAMLIAPNYYHPLKNSEIHAERTRRIKAVVNGQCKPNGWRDLIYEHCAIGA